MRNVRSCFRHILSFLILTSSGGSWAATTGYVQFEPLVIDAEMAGDCKMVGDIDGDGRPDLVVAGSIGEGLVWYQNPRWRKNLIAAPRVEFTTEAQLADFDRDGDLDIVVGDGNGENNLIWFENPLPLGDPANDLLWTRHAVGSVEWWVNDLKTADVDGDGSIDVLAHSGSRVLVFFQDPRDDAQERWTRMVFQLEASGEHGLAVGDINRDGRPDLVVRGGRWLENPGGSTSRDAGSWASHEIGHFPETFKAEIVDLMGSGSPGVIVSAPESEGDLVWWSPQSKDPAGPWSPSVLLKDFDLAHTLQVADMDGDGRVDVVAGQMHTSESKRTIVLYNRGEGQPWDHQVADTQGLHNGIVTDVNGDGLPDIFGSNFTGNPPVLLLLSRGKRSGARLPIDRWTRKQVTSDHVRTFGLGFGDLNGDFYDDILSGPFVYVNPGGDLMGEWVRHRLPGGVHGFASVRVDASGRLGVLAQRTEGESIGVFWVQPRDNRLASWDLRRIGTVPKASHREGAQGYRIAAVEPGLRPQVLISSGNGIYYFRIPELPEAGGWPRVHVSAHPSDEGFSVGDLNSDGRPDIIATTGATKRVEWYENPGDGSDGWKAHVIGEMPEAVFPDRVEVADLNGDQKLDVIVSEENGRTEGASTFWWEHPAGGEGTSWTRHLLTVQGSTNSLDVGELERDGRPSIVTGEHAGANRVIIWSPQEGGFTPVLVDAGIESHLGVRLHDLRRAGVLDIVSIGWEDPSSIWLWRNDAVRTRPAGSPSTDRSWLTKVGARLCPVRKIVADVLSLAAARCE